jgi:ribose transport system permease protein
MMMLRQLENSNCRNYKNFERSNNMLNMIKVTEGAVKPKNSIGNIVVKYPQLGTIGVLLLMFIFYTIFSPINKAGENVFLSWRNIATVLELSAAFSIGAFAMTMVLLSGGIDLSCGATIALSGVVTGNFMTNLGFHFILAAIIGLIVGVIIGLINAFIIIELKLPPFLATIGVANAFQGVAFMISQGKQVYIKNPGFTNTFGFGDFLGIPSLVWWTAFFLIITYLIISKMKFGRRLQAVGGNEVAAQNSGVNVRKIKYMVYAFMGLVSAFVSLTIAGRIKTAMPDQGNGYALNFIVCAVLGGTDFVGNGGNVFGVLLGSLVITVFSNGLNLMGTDSYLKMVLQGVIIILAIVASVALSRKRTR